ncbi:MAG: TolC family protein [Acidobacteria bacterium]|nr:TolC family protein [Acidobacteriota bacterium]
MKLPNLKTPIYSLVGVCLLGLSGIAQTPEAKAIERDAATTAPVATAVRATSYSPTDLNRVGVQTAQPVSLSLADAIRRALENNNDLEISRDDVRIQKTRVTSLEGVYDPVFTMTPTFSSTSNAFQSRTHDFRANAGLNQFIKPGGGTISSFFNNSRTESAFAQAQATSGSLTSSTSSALFSSNLGVNYTQPLWRNFRYDSRRHSIYVARKNLEQTESDFRLSGTNTITNVQRAYWDFVFALRNQQNVVANVDLAKENLRQIEFKIQAGAAAPLERAEVATELANRQGDLLLATQQVGIAENALKQLIIRDPLSVEWTESFTPTDPPAFSLNPVNLDDAMKDAMDNRFELRRLKLQQEINKSDIKYYKNQTKPQIDLNTSFSLNGLASGGTAPGATTSNLLTGSQDVFLFNSINATRASLALPPLVNPIVNIPAGSPFLFGNFGRSMANMFRPSAPNYSIGVTISFPFRNRTAKANLAGAEIQEHQLEAQVRGQENQVLVDVRNAVQAVETARQRVVIAQQARENAEIQLAGEQKLYENGKSTTFLLFQRENELTNARNNEIRAQTDYNKAIADLQRVTATSFRDNNIQVKDPLAP